MRGKNKCQFVTGKPYISNEERTEKNEKYFLTVNYFLWSITDYLSLIQFPNYDYECCRKDTRFRFHLKSKLSLRTPIRNVENSPFLSLSNIQNDVIVLCLIMGARIRPDYSQKTPSVRSYLQTIIISKNDEDNSKS